MKLLFSSMTVMCALGLGTPALAQFTILHSFSNAATDGGYPDGSLIQSGSTLYGMTSQGGTNGDGTIFKMQTDGTGFDLIHSFPGIPGDGMYPQDSLIQSGSILYGMTRSGGSGSAGTIFQMGTDGTGFRLIQSFASTGLGVANPSGSLIQSGLDLYGMTPIGGSYDAGAIFRIGTDGTSYSLLHSFDGGDGGYPNGSLIQSDSTLFGMTSGGVTINAGAIFQIGIDGTGFSLLHSFANEADDGAKPYGSLIQSGSTLYGMTLGGGRNSAGTIFQIGIDGSGFRILHSFSGGLSDGAYPSGSLVQSGSTLYGMTFRGGNNDAGTIFSLVIPEPSAMTLAALSAIGLFVFRRRYLD